MLMTMKRSRLFLSFSALVAHLPLALWGVDRVTLTFAGDLMAHERNQSMPDYADLYRAQAPWLLTDDWSFINLETPVNPAKPISGYPTFNAHPPYVEAAVEGGFDVFALANNHSNDGGVVGIEATLGVLNDLEARRGVRWSGLKASTSEPLQPTILEKGGWRIGFVSITNLVNSWAGANRVNFVATWDIWSRRDFSENQVALVDQVRQWRSRVDCLVLGLHDGVEYAPGPTAIQVALYRRLAEAGVDILWGHHPHVLQPWTWVTTPRGRALVLYSLGNYVSRQAERIQPTEVDHRRAPRGDGALFQVELLRTPAGVKLVGATPVLLNNYLHPERGMIVAPTGELVETAAEEWRPYFRHRWGIQKAWALPGD